MAARGASLFKFVGTVSLGLLTTRRISRCGLSYTLSTLTIPALLTLPSANAAAKGFESLASTAKRHVKTLSAVSGSAFLLAYFLSPRSYRHPYLLYTSTLVLISQLASSDLAAPFLSPQAPPSSGSSAASIAARKQKKKDHAAARARMEASYEVLGATSDSHSEGTGSASGEEHEAEEENMNGEEVRVRVEAFLKQQVVQATVAGLGFLLSVVGIWGDGVAPVYGQTIIIEA
ncbi:hypothetical protein B0T17DRAFT_508976 [Bombardia bombarda]|uniref:Autophagy-related protein 33 n=1 Tax=Bombardia bombarda TaxID=252184 RepID=A0AA39WU35_9PEZI|nr:hypothetical protein B0T17DRAFT_508976 [Bombardia bombarda]